MHAVQLGWHLHLRIHHGYSSHLIGQHPRENLGLHQASFTANANQSNESVNCARVVSTEVYAFHRGKKNWFLPPWILIFTTVEIDFYHRRN